MPICILERIYRQCLQLGLNSDDARDCVAEVCLRYHKRTGAFPQDEATPDLHLLRLLTLNVVREHQRTQQRRLRLEQDYLAQQGNSTPVRPPRWRGRLPAWTARGFVPSCPTTCAARWS
jgi:DNA-directed RNA polymerase specialized sigma24 family protein